MGTRTLARLVLALTLTLGGLVAVGFGADSAHAAARATAPRSVRAEVGDGAVTVRWRPPARTGGSKVLRYQLQRWVPDRQRWVLVRTVRAGARSATETGLTNGRTYFHRVLARTRAGAGRPSKQTTSVPRGRPGAVPDLEGSALLEGLRVTWSAAASNGSPVTGYVVELSGDGARTWTAARTVTTRTTTYEGLQAGGRLRVRVRAVNAAGEGANSEAGPYTPQARPGQVTDLVVTRVGTSVSLTWREPASGTGGVPRPARYRVESRNASDTDWVLLDTVTGTTFQTTAPDGVPVDYRVTSEVTASSGVPVTAGAPDAPGTPALTHDEQSGQQTLAWAAPLSDGRSPLTSYEIDRGGDDTVDQTVLRASPSTLPATSAVTDGTAGPLRVRACNELLRCSDWSAPVVALAAAPSAPTGAVEVQGATLRVPLTWTAAATGATTATAYRVQRRVAGGSAWTTVAASVAPSSPAYTDATVAAETTYEYRVVPVADGVDGVPSAASTPVATGVAQSIAWAVPDLTVTAGDLATDVTLSLGRASTSDVLVHLSASSEVGVPAQVTIPAGETSVVVPVSGVQESPGPVTVTATADGLTADLAVTVTAPPPPVI